jgi:hypothetical protein
MRSASTRRGRRIGGRIVIRSRLGAAMLGAALLLATAALAGCGGSSNTSGTEAEPAAELSHTEWVSAADEICEEDHEANAGREERFGDLLQRGVLTPKTRAAAAALIRGALPSIEAEVADLGKLTPDASDQEAAAEVIAELKLTIKLNRRLAAGLDHGSVTELETLAQEVQENASALEGIAADLGLTVCGRPAEPE